MTPNHERKLAAAPVTSAPKNNVRRHGGSLQYLSSYQALHVARNLPFIMVYPLELVEANGLAKGNESFLLLDVCM